MFTQIKRKVSLVMVAVMLTTVTQAIIPVQTEAASSTKVVKKAPIIASIANITKTVDVDAEVIMPATVTAVMSDKTNKAISVKWDKVLNADIDGTYIANGTVAGFAKKVLFTLKVKAPKMGTIDIPKVTDSSLKKPSDIKLGIGKGIIDENYHGKELDETLPSVFWCLDSAEADEYIIRVYDQYKRVVSDYGTVMNEEDIERNQGDFQLHLDKVKNMTISTITITPVKTTEEGRMTGNPSKNGYGETAVFNCSIKVVSKAGKQIIMSTKPNEGNPKVYDLYFNEKVAPYKYFSLRSNYKYVGSSSCSMSDHGYFTAKDGTVSIIYVQPDEYNVRYANLSAKLSLLVYTDAIIESTDKATYTITTYPVNYKDNPVAKAAKAFDGVYNNGKQTLVVSTKGTDAKYYSGDIHVVQDSGSDIYYYMSPMFDGKKKITNTIQNGDGPYITIELVLDGDTIHYTRTFHQQNNLMEKRDFKRTKDDALKTYEKYFKLMFGK